MLIELMIAVAILGIGVTILNSFEGYQRATHRAAAIEGAARALDLEMERTAACLSERAGRLASTCAAPLAAGEASTWIGAPIQKSLRPTLDGLVEVQLRVELDGVRRPLALVALLGGRR